jgi:hypothetical protein
MEIQYSSSPTVKKNNLFSNGYFWFEQSVTYNMSLDNLVKFLYKLGKNWQTRAWDPVFKTAGSAPNASMIHGLFSHE